MDLKSQILTEWQELEQHIAELKASSLFVLVDEHTSQHCWPLIARQCPILQHAEILEVPAGESSKTIEIATQLWQALMELGADRHSVFINLGGGMVTDLGGFIASTYMRGIRFIQIPTSLLAMVDAAIGGKTGVDLDNRKNLIGTFSNAETILVQASFLETLPHREQLSGFAEMIKHGIISGGTHWNEIRSLEEISAESISSLIAPSAAIKQKIVEQDFTESGLRKQLNLGHSFGHAIESIALEKNASLYHGEAVIVGMIAEAQAARLSGIADDDLNNELESVIARHYIYISIPQVSYPELLPYLLNDKKNHAGAIRFSLPVAPGKVLVDQEITADLQEQAWKYTLAFFNA